MKFRRLTMVCSFKRVRLICFLTVSVTILLFCMSPQLIFSEITGLLNDRDISYASNDGSTSIMHLSNNGNIIHNGEHLLKRGLDCAHPILYNKIFQRDNLIEQEADLEQNIRMYCGARENMYNILDMKPIKFLPYFKNPCWTGLDGNGPIADNKTHCLPYFYILGMKKSGTTDIFSRLSRHPLFQSAGYKELQWFPRLRFGRAVGNPLDKKYIKDLVRNGPDVQSINFYIAMFDPVARHIHSLPTRVKGNRTIFKVITGDATTNTILENPRWHLWPGNEGRSEPRYTNLDYIKHLTPDAKVILLFRDPVERLYSDYLYTMRGKYEQLLSPELFHRHALFAIKTYKDCLGGHSLRQCFYNETISERLKKEGVQFADSFHTGFYAFITREVYSVFDQENVLTQVMFDNEFSLESTMKRIFKFLDLGILSKEVMTKILDLNHSNTSTKKRREYGSILDETKHILQEFYRPFNREMADLMNNDRYLFDY